MEDKSPVQPAEPPDPLAQTVEILRADLTGLFMVADVAPRPKLPAIAFAGRFLQDPDASYDEIHRRFQRHGHTPFVRREGGQDVILAVEGLVDRPRTGNPLVNILLLVATILTTLSAGAAMAGYNVIGSILLRSPLAVLQALLAGIRYGQGFNLTQPKICILITAFCGILARLCDHFRGQVNANYKPLIPDNFCCPKNIHASTTAKVQDLIPRLEF